MAQPPRRSKRRLKPDALAHRADLWLLKEFRWTECYDDEGNRHPIVAEPPPQVSEFRTLNPWWSFRYQMTVAVVQNPQGRARFRLSFENRLAFTLRTLEAAAVWPLETVEKARKKLASLINRDLFELYLLTGHFAETSKRSQATWRGTE